MVYLDSEEVLLRRASQDLAWFKKHYEDLLREHEDHFVAVKDGRLAATGETIGDVIKELDNKNVNPATTLIKFVTRKASILNNFIF